MSLGMTSLTFLSRSELNWSSISLPAQLILVLEVGAATVCEVSSWMDWWLGAVSTFQEHLPAEEQSLFSRLLDSGHKCISMSARTGIALYANLMLVHRDGVLKHVQSTVPQEAVALMRNAALPSMVSLVPDDLARSALEKKRAAEQDALFQKAIASPKIPRVS